MPTVTIDGVNYHPASSIQPARVGIAITTRDRQSVLENTLANIRGFTPAEFPVVVVDDGSDLPVRDPDGYLAALVRNETSQGIPAAKNRCIEELMKLGVEHMFLFDDDTRPAVEDWWKPYVDGAEPHYQYCWTHSKPAQNARGPKIPARPIEKMTVLYGDSKMRAFGWSMGCMLYVTADVVRRVGGMDWEFGMGMEEHAEWSQRIYNCGFTSFIHQDVAGSADLFYASDEHGTVSRSFEHADRMALLVRNEALRIARIDSTVYVDFRRPRDVVLAPFFTGHVDPQRGVQLAPDEKLLEPLISTIRDKIVVLHNCFDEIPGIENIRVEAPWIAYKQRWLTHWQWLRDHPEVRYAWLVDATDVRMLNDPFPHMKPDTLYVGWETLPVGCQWLRDNSTAAIDWVEANQHRMLLNCGVIGGDRNTVMQLCRRVHELFVAHPEAGPTHDMVFVNMAAYEHHNLITGPRVTTVFKANKKLDPYAFWAHK